MRSALNVLLAVAALFMGSVQADAQSFNIDMNTSVTPPNTYGAATGQTGFWDSYLPTGAWINLRNLSGALTNVQMRSAFDAGFDQCAAGVVIAPPHQELFCDYVRGTPNRTFRIRNLQSGVYGVFTYCWRPGGAQAVACIPGNAFMFVSNPVTWPGLALGRTHAAHRVVLPAGTTLRIRVNQGMPDGFASVCNGIQLVRVGPIPPEEL